MKLPKDFFIFDLANNHCWDVEFWKKIIDDFIEVIKGEGIDGAIKFQFRDLDTFINNDPIHSENKYIKRFSETRMQDSGFEQFLEKLRSQNIKTICTPFDENSVKKIVEMWIDIIKIWSCSAMDWRLLESAVKSQKPIICSTWGLSLNEIDEVVSYLESNSSVFALMHCISIYPTKDEDLELNQISILKKRYPHVTIGYSTHEDPENYDAIKIACSLWAEIFEKHITIDSDIYPANNYSIKPYHALKWIQSYKKAKVMIDEIVLKLKYRKTEFLTQSFKKMSSCLKTHRRMRAIR
jgi:sialic acid synthase SpsE